MEKSIIIIYGQASRSLLGNLARCNNIVDLAEEKDYEFIPGVRYLVVWNDKVDPNIKEEQQPYKIITQEKGIHLGPRGENHWDISRMNYLITKDGCIFKFIYIKYKWELSWLNKETYDLLSADDTVIRNNVRNPRLSTGISKKTGRPWYRLNYQVPDNSNDVASYLNDESYIKSYDTVKYHKVIRNNTDIDNAFNYFLSTDQLYGLDYETSGFPFDDKDFYHMGVSIVGIDGIAAYFDMEGMDTQTHNLDYFLSRYKDFLDKKAEMCYTCNVSFEMRCTYLLFHKIYYFHEASAINKCDGLVVKNFSLKYTAMRTLGVPSWDDYFDAVVDINDIMMNGRYDKRGNVIVEPSTKENYKDSDQWKYLMERFPEEESEFDRLLSSYWGNPFKCIPANILGEYCCIDSFNTVKIREYAKSKYTDKCWECYDNNLRLGALLGIYGCLLDIDTRNSYDLQAQTLEMIGKANMLYYYLNNESKYFNINLDDNNVAFNLLRCGVDVSNASSIISYLYDPNYSSGINTDKYDSTFRSYRLLYDELVENGGLDPSSWKNRKIKGVVGNHITSLLNPNYQDTYTEFTIDNKLYKINYNIGTIVYSQNVNKSLNDVRYLLSQVDHNKTKDEYIFEGNKYTTGAITERFKDIYNLSSPINMSNDDYMIKRSTNNLTRILSRREEKSVSIEEALKTDHEQLPIVKVDVVNSASDLKDRADGYAWMLDSANRIIKRFELVLLEFLAYSESLLSSKTGSKQQLSIANTFINSYKIYNKDGDGLKFLNTLNFSCSDEWISGITDEELEKVPLTAQSFKELQSKLTNGYRNQQPHVDWSFHILGISRLNDDALKYFYDHYDDIDITDGSIFSIVKIVISDVLHKKYRKMTTTYLNGQFTSYNRFTNGNDDQGISTERWRDSGVVKMYTPYAVCQKQSKRWSAGIHTVPSWSEVKRVMIAPKNTFFSYFDISGAEVRAISYLSGDEYMLDCYSKKLDPYTTLARQVTPGHDDDYYREVRSDWKQILLGSMYGMGIPSMADRVGISVEEATKKHEEMFKRMKGIKRLIEEKGDYCVNHDGLIESYLGDVLEMDKGDTSRYSRLGINQFIQNIASVSLADGFFNNLYHASKLGYNIYPQNVVHDSSQNIVEGRLLFDIFPFYHHNLTDYLYDLYGIKYEFDLEVGCNYFDMCDLSQIDNDTISLKGNYTSINGLLTNLGDSLKYELVSVVDKKSNTEIDVINNKPSSEFKPKLFNDTIEQFNSMNMMAHFNVDKSKYVFTIKRIK